MSDKYTVEQIHELRNAACSGQWTARHFAGKGYEVVAIQADGSELPITAPIEKEDAEFIAAAPDIVRQLVEQITETDTNVATLANKYAEVAAQSFTRGIELDGARNRFAETVGKLEAENTALRADYAAMKHNFNEAMKIIEARNAEIARLRGNVSEVD